MTAGHGSGRRRERAPGRGRTRSPPGADPLRASGGERPRARRRRGPPPLPRGGGSRARARRRGACCRAASRMPLRRVSEAHATSPRRRATAGSRTSTGFPSAAAARESPSTRRELFEPAHVEGQLPLGVHPGRKEALRPRDLVADPTVSAVPGLSLGRRSLEHELHVHGKDDRAPPSDHDGALVRARLLLVGLLLSLLGGVLDHGLALALAVEDAARLARPPRTRPTTPRSRGIRFPRRASRKKGPRSWPETLLGHRVEVVAPRVSKAPPLGVGPHHTSHRPRAEPALERPQDELRA